MLVVVKFDDEFFFGEYYVVVKCYWVNLLVNDVGRVWCIGKILVVIVGMSDLLIVEEVCVIIDWMGVDCDLLVDVGVVGFYWLVEK